MTSRIEHHCAEGCERGLWKWRGSALGEQQQSQQGVGAGAGGGAEAPSFMLGF